jgi:nucleoside-diphosphate-sugar epimerase
MNIKKAAVTGGAGFIGSNLVNKLINQGIEVLVIDDLSTGKKENINPKAEFYFAGLHKISTVELTEKLKGIDVVFHTAALARVQPSIIDPIGFNEVNVNGTLNLLKACVDANVKRVVYSASSSCYGNNKNFPTPEPLTINNDGEQRRDFTYVGDVVDANILAATHKEKLNGESFNVGNGDNFSVNELADMFGGEKTYGNKVIEPFKTLADNTKIKTTLGWDPKGNLPTWVTQYKKELKIQ